jgi:SAM-dependent methyltransferase
MTSHNFAENRYQQFIESLNRYQGNSIKFKGKGLLDIGSGTGDFLHIASSRGWQVEGIELSESSAKRANQLLGGDFVRVGTLDDCNLSSDSYDLITSYHVIEHLIDPVSMLNEIYNLLKPGGIVFLETPNMESIGAMIRGAKWSNIKPPEHINYFNPASLGCGLEKAGFSRIHTYTIRPQKIESLQVMSLPLRSIANAIYGIAPLLNMGASLQAIATKPFAT